MPNDDEARELVENCLKALALYFSDETIEIDESVFNAARITKLYGTAAVKGDNVPERPHRRSGILEVPPSLKPVPVELLEKLAAQVPKPQTGPGFVNRFGGRFDLQGFIQKAGLTVRRTKSWGGGVLYELENCPFNPEHKRTARIVEFSNGALSFGCFHNSCSGYDWHKLRTLFEPGQFSSNSGTRKLERDKKVRQNNPQEKPPEEPAIIPLADVEPEPLCWLWEPYLPAGKLAILEGDPGVGKTWVALAICAKLTTEGHNVLYATCEDGLADTIRPRVDSMGADLQKFYILRGKKTDEKGAILPFTLADVDVLRQAMEEYRPSLLTLDPFQGFIGADVDLYRANELRGRLAAIIRLAEEYRCAVLLVRHLAKRPTERVVYRGLGSIDLAAAARSILLVGRTKDGQKVVVQTKASLGAEGKPLAFEIWKGQFLWRGHVEIDAWDVLAPPVKDEETSAVEGAMEWLVELLAGGPLPAREVFKHARNAGIAEKTLRRAKDQLNVLVSPLKEKGRVVGWLWSLPNKQSNDQMANPYIVSIGHLESKAANPYKFWNSTRWPTGNSMAIWQESRDDAGFRPHVPDGQEHTIEDDHLDETSVGHLENLDEEAEVL